MTNLVRRNVLVAAAAALLAVGIAGCAGSPEEATATPAPAEVAEVVEPAAEEVAEVAAPDIAVRVREGIEAGFPGGIDASSPLFAITEYESLGSDTVRVYVQESLDDSGRDEIARQIGTMTMLSSDELRVIVVRDASGVDSNHYR